MACSGCQQRREMLSRAVQAARQGNFTTAKLNLSQMTRSVIGRGPNSNLSTKPPAASPYRLRLTKAAQDVYHMSSDGSKAQS